MIKGQKTKLSHTSLKMKSRTHVHKIVHQHNINGPHVIHIIISQVQLPSMTPSIRPFTLVNAKKLTYIYKKKVINQTFEF